MRTRSALALALLIPHVLVAGEVTPLWEISPSPDTGAPLSDRWALDLDTAVLMRVSNTTPLNYTVVAEAISLRTPEHIHIDLDGGAKIVVRGHYSLLAEAFAEGAESYYLGISGSPSIEFWPRSERFNIYFAIGGGLGVVDSTDIPGGQGQDLTLNWFIRSGIRYHLSDALSVGAGIFFQHLSNGGMAEPNPGLDVLGPSVGLTFRF